MGKLGNISGKEAARAFQRAGWEPVGQVGSHLVLIKSGVRVNLSVPSTRSSRWEPWRHWSVAPAWRWTSFSTCF